ncbi:hypothetical protein Bca101_002214 [Brassica carinata]
MEASLAAVDRPRGAASNTSNEGSVGSVNMVLILKQEVKHLQHKLEEARADLNAKEARIQELEYSKIEYEFEGIFRERSKLESSTWCQERGVGAVSDESVERSALDQIELEFEAAGRQKIILEDMVA